MQEGQEKTRGENAVLSATTKKGEAHKYLKKQPHFSTSLFGAANPWWMPKQWHAKSHKTLRTIPLKLLDPASERVTTAIFLFHHNEAGCG